MSEYLMYLRKSALDRDFDNAKGETLARHKAVLTELAEKNHYNVTKIFEEVVSGDSLAARPKMQECLEYISTGNYSGVLCMDIDRLSRGSSFDSGYITNILQVNNCQIITPQKTYDLNGEYDEQFTDLKFMFARMELKTIAKRTKRGRDASAKEGKWTHRKPFGYNIVDIPGTKGKTLAINEPEADTVRLIFELSAQGKGHNVIARELTTRNIPPVGASWNLRTVAFILNNKVYLGYVPYHQYTTKKTITPDGKVSRHKIISADSDWIKGLHPPIITQEQWDFVHERFQRLTPIKTGYHMANMFSGLIKCKYCGKTMTLTSSRRDGRVLYNLQCRTPECPTTRTALKKTESIIMQQVNEWLCDIAVSTTSDFSNNLEEIYTKKLNALKRALSNAQSRQAKICDYLENGTYTLELFQTRNETIQKEIDQIKTEINNLEKPEPQSLTIHEVKEYLKLIDIYWEMTNEEKNKFLKAIIKNIIYDRTSVHNEPIFKINYKI